MGESAISDDEQVNLINSVHGLWNQSCKQICGPCRCSDEGGNGRVLHLAMYWETGIAHGVAVPLED